MTIVIFILLMIFFFIGGHYLGKCIEENTLDHGVLFTCPRCNYINTHLGDFDGEEIKCEHCSYILQPGVNKDA